MKQTRPQSNRTRWTTILLVASLAIPGTVVGERLLVPMDLTQSNHLRSYGLAIWVLKRDTSVQWLLNYRGGAFVVDANLLIAREAQIRGVSYEVISETDAARLFAEIADSNMEVIHLDKAPRIAVYTPPNSQPWDDAVTMALEYAQIDYDKLWDEQVLDGKLSDYDWLHLHHEDFTGQYGKFYASYGHEPWYRDQQKLYEGLAHRQGFAKVSDVKKAVVAKIHQYMRDGGFLFAMCSATDTFDITLAALGIDIAEAVFDGDPADPVAQDKLDFQNTVAFEDFTLETNPLVYEHSDIDTTPANPRQVRSAYAGYFTIFEFSAKHDPVPTMLTQCHTTIVNGFMGQTTGFRRRLLKDSVIILGEVEGEDEVKYIHGIVGKGTFTFYGGHDPEDHRHHVGDPPTRLELFPNSPGYRLILNNVLFPAAKKKERKT